MVTINNLPEQLLADVSDEDLLVIYDMGGGATPARKVTRGDLLSGVARTASAAAFTTLSATTSVAAPAGAIDALTVATSLIMGATLQRMLKGAASVAIPLATTLTEVTATIAVTGAVVGDLATLHLPSTWPAGLIARATVTAPDTVTIYAFNATAGSIAGASHSITAIVSRYA